jgi:formate/nitrite transporter FocA (FNT family)
LTTVTAARYAVFNHEGREDVNHEAHERSKITKRQISFVVFAFFAVFVVRASEGCYGVLAEKLNEMPPEMARLVLFESSGLESVRPTPM